MTEHDDLCPMSGPVVGYRTCHCDLIAKARADERERIAQRQEKWAQELMTNNRHSWHGTAILLAKDLPRIAREGAAMSEFPPHEHVGDQYSPDLCCWTREDGESCQFPLTEEGLRLRLDWAMGWARNEEREEIAKNLWPLLEPITSWIAGVNYARLRNSDG